MTHAISFKGDAGVDGINSNVDNLTLEAFDKKGKYF
jgi:hypothetical protein